MYSFVGRAVRLQWGLLVLAALLFVTVQAQSSSSSFASSSETVPVDVSYPDELPCKDNSNNDYVHGAVFKMTDCSECECNNGTLRCQFESCQPPTCREPKSFEGECCRLCPYNVTVSEVTPINARGTSIKEGQADNELAVNLDVLYVNTRETTSVKGQGLWTTRMWMSSSEDGSDELSGTVVEEVLTEGQQSQDLQKSGPSSTHFYINNIRYLFDLSGHTCSDARYLCAKFNKGANPKLEKSFLAFAFEARPTEEVLTGCTEIDCQGVTIRGLRANGRTNDLVVGRKSDVTIDGTATFTDRSRDIAGSGLWRMGIFGSKNEQGKGEKFDYQSQTLSTSHQAQPLTPGGPRELTFTGAKAQFDWLAVGCNGFDYLCYDFSKGPNPNPDYTFAALPSGDTITLCSEQPCRAGTTISSTSARLNSGKVADGRATNPYSIDYSATGGGTGIVGEGMWALSAYGSPNADGSGKMLGEQTQVFNQRQASLDFLPAESTRLDYGQVDFNFDMTGLTCEDVKYICLKMRKGESPSPDFTLTPEPNEDVMRTCVPAECSGVIAEQFDWKYNPGNPIPGQKTPVQFDAALSTRTGSRDLSGTGLWRMGMYGSRSADGDPSDRFGYVSQALNPAGSSTTLQGGSTMNIRNQQVDFDIGSIGCNEYGYICAEFTKGDMPEPDFRFEVSGRSDVTDNVMTSCKKQKCSARAVFTGLETSIGGDGPVIEEKMDNQLTMDITGVTGEGSTEVTGTNLWRVGMYGSGNRDGRGRKLAYQEQVLSQLQRDQTLETDADLPFTNTQVSFDMRGLQCVDVKYLCTELRKNPDADPDYTFDAEPNERALVSCTELGDRCKGVTVTDMDWSYDSGAMQYGMPTPLAIDATVRTTPESRELQGSGLWKMNLFGSRNIDGSGQRRTERSQILDGFNQAKSLPAGGPVEFDNIGTRFPMDDLGCGEYGYLCLEFEKGVYANPRYSFRTNGPGESIINCKSVDCGGVYVSGVDSTLLGGDLFEGKPANTLQFDTVVQTTDESVPMVGRNMWRLNLFGSERSNGQGPRYNPQEQVLNDYFSSQELMTPGEPLNFQTINSEYDMTGVNCKKLKYLCTEFSRNPSSSRDFALTPVPNERVLRDCMEVPEEMCRGVVIDDMDWGLEVLSDKVITGQPSPIRLSVDVEPRPSAGSAAGDGLWRVGVFGSTRPDGKGKQIGLRRQILNRPQSSRDLTAGDTLSFPQIDTEFDLSAIGCESEFQYLCVEYAKGLRAQPDFKFENARGGEVVTRCKDQDCRKGVKVRGLNVVGNDYSILKENDRYNRVMLNLEAVTTPDSGSVFGDNLWDLTLYGSQYENGAGQRFNEQQGAFSSYQRNKDAYPGENIDFGMVDANFNMEGLTCKDVRYLCAELNQGSRPDPPFEFTPVPDRSVLRKCIRQKCDGITIESTDLRGDNFDITDETTEFEFDFTVTSSPTSGDAIGQGLWNVNTFVSQYQDGTGNIRHLDRQTLTPEMASQNLRSGNRMTFNNVAARISKEAVSCDEGGGYFCVELSKGERSSFDFTLAAAREGALRKCRKLNCVKAVKPERGPVGDKGYAGEAAREPPRAALQGPPGHPGVAGPAGLAGLQGYPGRMGPSGVKGIKGDEGKQGYQGPEGPPGPPGPPGEALAPTYQQNYGAMKGPGYAGYPQQQVIQGPPGPPGLPGSPGHRGAQGLHGSEGDIGPAGRAGITGPPGPRGPAGDDGRDGSNGNSGSMGPAGPIGRQGGSGRPGRPGAQGHKGWRGARGRKGALGDTGDAGDSGATGAVGPAGAPGARGDRGVQGERGERGSRGAVGTRGQDGSDGDVGNAGPQGSSGPMGAMGGAGAKGDAGPQGDVGSQGLQGQRGEDGSSGSPGPTGATGNAGTDGATGSVGDVGAVGMNGPSGAAGPRGSAGTRGAAGVAGDAGAQGYPGLAGSRGSDGPRGVAGTVGLRGERGTDGAEGSDGPDGPVGATGPRGLNGARGSSGPSGPGGPLGGSGLRGDVGAQGSRGAPGERGDAGDQGRTGDAGAPGQQGAPGPSGRPGNDGKPGPSGPGGSDGRPGPPGPNGLQGQRGVVGLTGSKGATGEEGRTGAAGAIGQRGPAGAAGEAGPEGVAGPQGAQGLRGDSGPQGSVGPTGPNGGVGATGARGAQGRRGGAGVAGNAGPGGPAGATGNRGERGPMGLAGPFGPDGDTGADGRDGRDGETGDKGSTGDVGRLGIPGLPGPPGDRGGIGAIGNLGAPGARGATGKRGVSGNPGQRGNAGPQGHAGSQGLRGEGGDVGRSGATGLKGPKGNPGERGRAGERGAQGIPGGVGPQGLVGARGEKGPRGVVGNPGPQGGVGAPGRAGPPGAAGAHGNRGEDGAVGAVGPGGPSGLMGAPGPTGAIGARGEVGPSGANGRPGAVGQRGETGSTGPKGIRGVPGPEGSAGSSGEDGRTGADGPAGPAGPTGPSGIIGELGGMGAVGAPGPTGQAGRPGADGSPGRRGSSGEDGGPGRQGPQGVKGSRGATGSDGRDGSDGAPGAKGATGPSGDKGPQGAQGPAGIAGAPGRQGGVGSQGERGTRGSAGPAGPRGSTGADGNMGPAGPAGPAGAPGETGAAGAQGHKGWGGGPGAPGSPGPKGAAGARGPNGRPGPAGPAGIDGARGKNGKNGQQGPRGMAGPGGQRGADGRSGPAGPPGPRGRAGAPGALSYSGYAYSGGSYAVNQDKGQNPYAQYYGDDATIAEDDYEARIIQLRNRIERLLLPNGEPDYPARSCKDLFKCHPILPSGYYTLDPSEGSHYDKFVAYCDKKTNATCIYPDYPEIPRGTYYLGETDETIDFSEMRNGSTISYSVKPVQLTLLRLIYSEAKQNLTYHCRNSHAVKSQKGGTQKALTLVGPNDVRISIKNTQADLQYKVDGEDGCRVHDNTWGKTTVSYSTKKTERLPLVDFAVTDVGRAKQQFGVEVGPVCFS